MISPAPPAMATDGSLGVLDSFQTVNRPVSSSSMQTSVKVPPESTPMRSDDISTSTPQAQQH
jgi:hypothetical protein